MTRCSRPCCTVSVRCNLTPSGEASSNHEDTKYRPSNHHCPHIMRLKHGTATRPVSRRSPVQFRYSASRAQKPRQPSNFTFMKSRFAFRLFASLSPYLYNYTLVKGATGIYLDQHTLNEGLAPSDLSPPLLIAYAMNTSLPALGEFLTFKF